MPNKRWIAKLIRVLYKKREWKEESTPPYERVSEIRLAYTV